MWGNNLPAGLRKECEADAKTHLSGLVRVR